MCIRDRNYTDPNLCAGVIADVFHISEKYVFQLLKSCCNETLNDRILRLRIDEGIRLLTTTDLTITTVSYTHLDVYKRQFHY